MQENNKKTLILSVIGVLVLIIAVVGVSFAMYSFSATGTRENVIQTGTASISFSGSGKCSDEQYTTYETCQAAGGKWTGPSTITLNSEYPKTDTEGLKNTAVSFTLTTDYPGTMLVNYALQFVDINEGEHNLKTDKVKLQITKTIDNNTTYAMGTATTGALMSSVKENTHKLTGTDGYVFDSGSFNAKGSITYGLKAWVDESYTLYYGDPEYSSTCSLNPETNNTATLCEANGGAWTQTKETTAETLTFKIRVVAAQVTE